MDLPFTMAHYKGVMSKEQAKHLWLGTYKIISQWTNQIVTSTIPFVLYSPDPPFAVYAQYWGSGNENWFNEINTCPILSKFECDFYG